MPDADRQEIEQYVRRTVVDARLVDRIVGVLSALPEDVRADLLPDPAFRIETHEYVPGRGVEVWMPSPGVGGSRCVSLKPRLATLPEVFALYVIAHELAHAYLRNGGWRSIDDPEAAADALAADWGFPKPATSPFR